MNVGNIMDKLNQTSTINLYLVQREKGVNGIAYNLFKTHIREEIGLEFRNVLFDVLTDYKEVEELDYIAYDPCVCSDRSVLEVIPSSDVPNFNNIKDQISNHVDLPTLTNLNEQFIGKIWAYCVHFQHENMEIVYFRKYSRSKVIKQGKGLSFLFSEGYLNKLMQDLFTFDARVDCVYIEDEIVVFHKTNFEQIFNFMDKFKELALQTFEVIENQGLIHNFEDFSEWCFSDPRKIRKLTDIFNKGYYESVSFEKVKEMKNEYSLQFELDEENEKIVCNNGKVVWEILKLYSDDYLTSKLTENNYEAHSKVKR